MFAVDLRITTKPVRKNRDNESFSSKSGKSSTSKDKHNVIGSGTGADGSTKHLDM